MKATVQGHPSAGKYYDHEAAYVKRYRESHDGWDRSFDPCEMELFIAQGFLCAGQRILNLGCGGGQEAILAARQGCLVDACDASPTALEMARQNLSRDVDAVRSRVQLICADLLEQSGFGGEPYDVVLDIHCFHCMVHEDHRRKFLEVARASLRPGGLLLSANMCGLPHTPALLATVELGSTVSRDGRRYFADEPEVRRALAAAGFQVVYWNRRRDPADVDYLLFGASRSDNDRDGACAAAS